MHLQEEIINDMGRDGIVFQPVKELDQIIYNADLSIQKAFDLMPVIVWISNPDSHCVFLNKCWYDFTGQTPETGLGAGWLIRSFWVPNPKMKVWC